MITKTGTILGIGGHPMSGLWHSNISGEIVHISSGYGVRNLAACFGATEGTGDLQEKIQDKKIVYSVNNFGVLHGFTPIDEWQGPDIPEEGIEEDDPPLI